MALRPRTTPQGQGRERWGASRRGRPVFLSFQRSCRPYDSVAVGGALVVALITPSSGGAFS